jgi:hypothetical protein
LDVIITELQRAPAMLQHLGSTRHNVADSILDQFDRIKVVEKLPLLDTVEEFEWEFINPAALLSEIVRCNPLVASAYSEEIDVQRRAPCTRR